MVSQGVMDWMASLAFRGLQVTASKALQETQVTLAYLEPKAFQGKQVPQDWAYLAQKASVVSQEIPDCLDHLASLVLRVPQALQDK